MYKVNILNELNGRIWEAKFKTIEERDIWIENHRAKNTWGMDERWVQESIIDPKLLSREIERETRLIREAKPERQTPILDDNGIETGSFTTQPATPEINEVYIKIKSDYLVSFTNLNEDPEFTYKQVVNERVKEYPSVSEFVEAFFDGGLDEYLDKRIAVKNKYPFSSTTKTLKVDIAWKSLRDKRDKFLTKTDFTQVADSPLSSEMRSKYIAYRQYLRDLPSMHNDSSVWDAVIPTFEEWDV